LKIVKSHPESAGSIISKWRFSSWSSSTHRSAVVKISQIPKSIFNL